MYQKREKSNKKLHELCEQLVQAKADWQNTFDSIPDMICILNKDRRITRANKAFSIRMNVSFNTLTGMRCHEILHRAKTPPPGCRFADVIANGQPARRESELRIGDIVYSSSLYPFRDASGALQGLVHIFRDITEQKAVKNRLIQSEKMAAIGTLAAELAHEINNPLDYISNYLYLLSDSLPRDFTKRDYIAKIEAGIDNLAALTRDLLDFSRPQLDAFVPLDIHRVIDDSLAFSEDQLVRTGITIIKSYRCENCTVMGSERMLRQVLLNMILNASDAMPEGGLLTLRTRSEEDLLILDIEDSGVGIPAVFAPKIFEPFFTTKKASDNRGTGLGLTICYNIIQAHNGEIHVESAEHKGARFVVSLPRHIMP